MNFSLLFFIMSQSERQKTEGEELRLRPNYDQINITKGFFIHWTFNPATPESGNKVCRYQVTERFAGKNQNQYRACSKENFNSTWATVNKHTGALVIPNLCKSIQNTRSLGFPF